MLKSCLLIALLASPTLAQVPFPAAGKPSEVEITAFRFFQDLAEGVSQTAAADCASIVKAGYSDKMKPDGSMIYGPPVDGVQTAVNFGTDTGVIAQSLCGALQPVKNPSLGTMHIEQCGNTNKVRGILAPFKDGEGWSNDFGGKAFGEANARAFLIEFDGPNGKNILDINSLGPFADVGATPFDFTGCEDWKTGKAAGGSKDGDENGDKTKDGDENGDKTKDGDENGDKTKDGDEPLPCCSTKSPAARRLLFTTMRKNCDESC